MKINQYFVIQYIFMYIFWPKKTQYVNINTTKKTKHYSELAGGFRHEDRSSLLENSETNTNR